MANTTYDVAIIGSGPGGYTAAFRAAKYGLKTVLIEKENKFGGTCLHVGCIPTKALLFQAEIYDYIQRAGEFGIKVTGASLDWRKMLERKREVVAKHAQGLAGLVKKNKVEAITGFGRLAGKGEIEVEQGKSKKQKIKAKNIILATGSDARLLPGLKEDGEQVLTNVSVLERKKLPRSMIVIGAGAVGVEFASIFHTFGTEVTLLEMLPRAVPNEDPEISAELEKQFKKRGIKVETDAKFENAKSTSKQITVTYTKEGKKKEVTAETLLVAVGRKPLTEGLGLEKTKAKVERGYLHTNEWMETAEPGLYAIGDIVAGMPWLAHAAAWQGLAAVARMAGKPATPVRRDRIPMVTFSEPQIGSVGLTEAQAKEKGYQVKTGKFPFLANSKASIIGAHGGFVKVIAEEKHGEILGVHIIGPQATEVIAEATVALQLEATVDDLMATVHAHPTLWEAMADGVNALRGLTVNI
ncbi:MAG: dihydrolipoyl dehydrogenase [Candidatus Acidoferrales bacterium]